MCASMAMVDGRPEGKSFLDLAVADKGSLGGGMGPGELLIFDCQVLPAKQQLKGLEQGP